MQKVKLTDYFEIVASIQDDKINFDVAEINDIDALPFISRTANNNGITDYCSPRSGKVNEGGVLSLALDGSTGATFFQYHPFLSGQNIWLLVPKAERIETLSPRVALYMVATIRKAVAAYSYNLSLTKTRLKNININLPIDDQGHLDLMWIEKEMSKVRHIELIEEVPDERYQILT